MKEARNLKHLTRYDEFGPLSWAYVFLVSLIVFAIAVALPERQSFDVLPFSGPVIIAVFIVAAVGPVIARMMQERKAALDLPIAQPQQRCTTEPESKNV